VFSLSGCIYDAKALRNTIMNHFFTKIKEINIRRGLMVKSPKARSLGKKTILHKRYENKKDKLG
jgi:hypothetical protein